MEFKGRSAVFIAGDNMPKPMRLKQFDDLPVRCFGAGEQESSWVILKSGQVFSFGYANDGKMGQNTPDTIPSYKALSPEMDTPVRFVDAQIVYNHSILLSEDGTMFSCGLGGNDGRLGQPDNSSKTCYVPTAILKWKEDIVCPIKQIAVGRFHCLAITEKDQLIAYGYNVRHLVDGQRGDIYLPTLVPNMSSIRVKQVATATHHHLVLAADGTVYTQGGPESNPRYLTKEEELDGIRITFVAAGVGYHSLAISESGDVYTWASGVCTNNGQLGQGNTSTAPQSLLSKPTKLETQIGTGAHFATLGQAVTFIVDGAGKLYGCGEVPFEIASRQGSAALKVPTLIDSIPPSARVVAIRAGEKHVLVALEKGLASLLELCIWKVRKLGLYRPEDPKCPRLPAELEQQLL